MDGVVASTDVLSYQAQRSAIGENNRNIGLRKGQPGNSANCLDVSIQEVSYAARREGSHS